LQKGLNNWKTKESAMKHAKMYDLMLESDGDNEVDKSAVQRAKFLLADTLQMIEEHFEEREQKETLTMAKEKMDPEDRGKEEREAEQHGNVVRSSLRKLTNVLKSPRGSRRNNPTTDEEKKKKFSSFQSRNSSSK
jgi:hypothetical protein